MISSTCVMTVWRNYINWKYMFMFSINNLARVVSILEKFFHNNETRQHRKGFPPSTIICSMSSRMLFSMLNMILLFVNQISNITCCITYMEMLRYPVKFLDEDISLMLTHLDHEKTSNKCLFQLLFTVLKEMFAYAMKKTLSIHNNLP